MACTNWRKVEDRIDWFLSNNPSATGMCAQHSWHSLGGDYGCPPAWGCEDANAVHDKLKSAGELQTTDLDCPPRGAYVVWKYGNSGHAAISLGDGTIATTDPSNGKMVGIEPITYPKKWGAANGGTPSGWSDYYNGVTFDVGGSGDMDIYNYVYSGKSEDTKPIALGEYVWVTKDTDDPAASGLEFKLVYLNVKLTWKGEGFGNIRVKFIREDGDSTAYQDYLVHSSQTEFLLTQNHMEAGEAGQGGKWYIKVTGAAVASAAVGTRYNKYATVKDKG